MDVNTSIAVDIMVRTSLGSASTDFNKTLNRMESDARAWATRMNKIMDSVGTPGGGGGSGGGSGGGGGFGGGGILGAAFKGAVIGSVTGLLVRAPIRELEDLISKIKEVSIESVKSAAEFERLTNSIAVFAGGTGNARAELQALDEAAKSTPGLALQSAEQGYQRLRAVGFAAQTAQDLIIGLGKEKLISGASEQNIDRVVLDLAKLKESTLNTGRELRSAFQNIATLPQVFQTAFGTIESEKIKKIIDTDPGAFFTKLAKTMKDTEIAAPGLSASWTSLENAYLQAQRAFGEPFLEPITKDVISLTHYLDNNADVWHSWGQSIADDVQGVIDIIGGIRNALTGPQPGAPSTEAILGTSAKLIGGAILNIATAGTTGTFQVAGGLEQQQRNKNDARSIQDVVGQAMVKSTTENLNAVQKTLLQQANKEVEEKLKDRLDVVKSWGAAETDEVKKNTSAQEAIRGEILRNSVQDEIAYQADIYKIKKSGLDAEYDVQLKAINAELALDKEFGSTPGKIAKDEAAKSKIITDHSAAITILKAQEIEKQRQLEQKADDERRRDLESYNTLVLTQAKNQLDAQAFDVERLISFTGTGYSKLVDIATQSYNDQTKTISANLALQLQDAKLTDQQRTNLTFKANSDIATAAEKTREEIIKIGDRQVKDQMDQIDRLTKHTSEAFQRTVSLLGTIGDTMKGTSVDKGFVGALGLALFGGDPDAQIKVFTDKIAKLNDERNRTLSSNVFGLRSADIDEQKGLLKDLTDRFAGVQLEIFRVTKAYEAGTASIEDYQKAQLDLFDSQARLKTADLASQIDAVNAKIKITPIGDTTTRSDLLSQANQLIGQQTELIYQNAIARKKLFDDTIVGLQTMIDKLKSGDPSTIRGLNDQFRTERLTAVRDGYRDIYKLQSEIAAGPYLASLEIEKQRLQDILDIRHKEVEAVIAINTATAQIADQTVYHADQANAKVLQFMASQKGVTDIMADFRTGMIQTGYDYIDKGLDKVLSKMGLLGNVLKSFISDLAKLAVNWVFRQLFGGGAAPGTSTAPGATSGAIGTVSVLQKILSGQGATGGQPTTVFPSTGLIPGSFPNTPGFNPTNAAISQALLGQLATVQQQQIAGTIPGVGGAPSVVQPGTSAATGSAQAASQAGGILGNSKVGKFLQSPSFAGALAGLGIGVGLGGSSTTGKILGGLGGAAIGAVAGEVVPTILAGTFAGLTALGFATLGIGAGLAVLAFILGKKSQEKAEKKQVNDISSSALTQIQQLISDVKAFKIDGSSAYQQGQAIRSQFVDAISKLKSKGGKALAQTQLGQIDSLLATLKTEGDRADRAKTIARSTDEAIVPTFATGGYYSGMGYQTQMVQMHSNEAIINASQIAALGGYQALQRVGVPGISMSGAPDRVSSSGGGGGSQRSSERPIYVVAAFGEEHANQMFDMVSTLGVAKKVKVASSRDLGGMNEAIGRKLAGTE